MLLGFRDRGLDIRISLSVHGVHGVLNAPHRRGVPLMALGPRLAEAEAGGLLGIGLYLVLCRHLRGRFDGRRGRLLGEGGARYEQHDE
jgi:hypothetical protein